MTQASRTPLADTPARLIAIASLLVGVWILVYWLWTPSRPPITFDSTPPDPTLTPPAPPAGDQPGARAARRDVAIATPDVVPNRHPVRVEPPAFREYLVRDRDTIEGIAARELGNPRLSDAIMRANPFVDPTRLRPGRTRLRLPIDPSNVSGVLVGPAGETTPTHEAAPDAPRQRVITHRIGRRDTLWDIARDYYGKGHLWTTIYEANRDVITNPDRPPVGETITIPPLDSLD